MIKRFKPFSDEGIERILKQMRACLRDFRKPAAAYLAAGPKLKIPPLTDAQRKALFQLRRGLRKAGLSAARQAREAIERSPCPLCRGTRIVSLMPGHERRCPRCEHGHDTFLG